jgi:TPR repeat protein
MKKILILLLLVPSLSWGADFEKGLTAVNHGDYATALKEWTPLAKQGHAKAQYNLGVMYNNGWGVVQNYKTAVKWYTLAAEQGHASAQKNLGVIYKNGDGVLQDNIYAHLWYNISASSGASNAAENRTIVEEKMTTADISKAQELARQCVNKNYKDC